MSDVRESALNNQGKPLPNTMIAYALILYRLYLMKYEFNIAI